MRQHYVKPGEKVKVIGNWSEVMMHMGLSDRPIEIELIRTEYKGSDYVHYSAQVYQNGYPFSAPITPGEAGFYYDEIKDQYYTYPRED